MRYRERDRTGVLYRQVHEWDELLTDSVAMTDFCNEVRSSAVVLCDTLDLLRGDLPDCSEAETNGIVAENLPAVMAAFSELQDFYALLVAHTLKAGRTS